MPCVTCAREAGQWGAAHETGDIMENGYDYLEHEIDDVLDFIGSEVCFEEHEDRDDLEQWLNDALFCDDCVTGNASGSYTFSRTQAAECVKDNLDLLCEAIDEFGGDYQRALHDPESADVTIRCYLLPEAISDALDQYVDDRGRGVDQIFEDLQAERGE